VIFKEEERSGGRDETVVYRRTRRSRRGGQHGKRPDSARGLLKGEAEGERIPYPPRRIGGEN